MGPQYSIECSGKETRKFSDVRDLDTSLSPYVSEQLLARWTFLSVSSLTTSVLGTPSTAPRWLRGSFARMHFPCMARVTAGSLWHDVRPLLIHGLLLDQRVSRGACLLGFHSAEFSFFSALL